MEKPSERLKRLLAPDHLEERLVHDESRYQLQMIVFPFILGLVALVMTIVNIITDTFPLGYFTFGFCIVSALSALLIILSPKNLVFSETLFLACVVVLFTWFLVTGGIEGFSPIWICLLPSCGLFIVGKKKGTILCAVQLLLIILILDTPVGTMLHRYEFTHAFCYRFPILYICMFLVGLFVEYVRELTANALLAVQERYRQASITDVLTGTNNRLGFNKKIAETCQNAQEYRNVALLMLDLDSFKTINDTYGHLMGDDALKKLTKTIESLLDKDAYLARWGGDEFAILLAGNYEPSFLEELCRHVTLGCARTHIVDGKEMALPVTIGAVSYEHHPVIDQNAIVREADDLLEKAKQSQKGSFLLSIHQ
jgi:diguanylate cyclase (GGDEF)-like protein